MKELIAAKESISVGQQTKAGICSNILGLLCRKRTYGSDNPARGIRQRVIHCSYD